VIPLFIPPLRQRNDDLSLLAQHFAERFAHEMHSPVPVLDASFLDELQKHHWPGNIRELGNFMQRVLSLNQNEVLDAACFLREFQPLQLANGSISAMSAPSMRIADLEKTHLENTLALAHGNRIHAARMLGISLRTVRNKIKEYGLPPRRYA